MSARRGARQAIRIAALALFATASCVIQSPDELVARRPPVRGVTVSPSVVTLEPTDRHAFSSLVLGDGPVPQGVTWSVRSDTGSAIGTVDADGVYRLTNAVAVDTRDYVVATSVADPGISGAAEIDIPAYSISVSPTTSDLDLGGSLAFTAAVRGLKAKSVSWTLSSGIGAPQLPPGALGTIDASGLYRAPLDAVTSRITVTALPQDLASVGGLPKIYGAATVQLHLLPPVLTAASGPVQYGTTLVVSGSGFLPDSAGIQRQVLFETTSGTLGGMNPYGVAADHFFVQVPFGAQWSGRLQLSMWGGIGYSFQEVRSNMLDAGLP